MHEILCVYHSPLLFTMLVFVVICFLCTKSLCHFRSVNTLLLKSLESLHENLCFFVIKEVVKRKSRMVTTKTRFEMLISTSGTNFVL